MGEEGTGQTPSQFNLLDRKGKIGWIFPHFGTDVVLNDSCIQTETEELLRYKQKPIRIPQKLVKQISLFVRKNQYFLYLPHSLQSPFQHIPNTNQSPQDSSQLFWPANLATILRFRLFQHPPSEIAIESSNFPSKLFFLPIEQ